MVVSLKLTIVASKLMLLFYGANRSRKVSIQWQILVRKVTEILSVSPYRYFFATAPVFNFWRVLYEKREYYWTEKDKIMR
jgi:hypothetical protein